jgi:hypothetical protein
MGGFGYGTRNYLLPSLAINARPIVRKEHSHGHLPFPPTPRNSRLVQSVASNPGPTLFTGIADAAKAAAVAQRLVADDLFSG